VNSWYITAYEPIRNIKDEVIGILYVGVLEERYNDIKAGTALAFLAITLLGAVGSMALAYLLSRPISRSIRQLVSASRELARGNLDAKVHINSSDELRELADTFNTMAAAVKARDEQLKEYASRRVRKSERLAMVGQLAAGVAHELNNPLQGIVAYSLLLLEEMPDDDDQRESVELIVTQANRCRDIVRGLLDFSRQKKPHKKPFDVGLVLEECVLLVERQALFHNIEIVKGFDATLPEVVIDPAQIQQVFMNLIMNAAEAMDGEGRLTLATRLDPGGEYVEVEFTDTGHGISEADMEKVFVPFFTTKDAGHGVGLGLAISYGIVREHKGVISVDSEVGRGTTFVVRLPVNAEAEEEEGVENGR
jgi:two-component system NtrC family sensor kinase